MAEKVVFDLSDPAPETSPGSSSPSGDGAPGPSKEEKVAADYSCGDAGSTAAASGTAGAAGTAADGAPVGGGKKKKQPVVCVVLGMAGSGKTTLMQRLNAHVHEKNWPSYLINLDPAVADVPFGCHIDIRDTVKYKEVMKQYGLGPNGGIMTALNLFATRFDQVMDLVDKRAKSDDLDFILLDTPGQIEVFTWSASGAIITETMASTYPTVLIYVVDVARTANPTTFMSNMLYACSILYKLQLPFVLCFNKIDVMSHETAMGWMQDFESFQEALDGREDESYMDSFVRSMSLVRDGGCGGGPGLCKRRELNTGRERGWCVYRHKLGLHICWSRGCGLPGEIRCQ